MNRLTLCLLVLLGVPAFAADSTDIERLRREFAARTEAAKKPVRAWYVGELERLQRSLAAKGDVEGALAVQREREFILIAGNWSWHPPGKKSQDEIEFRENGEGKHTNSVFQWKASGTRTFTLTLPDQRRATITFSESYSSYKGTDFDGTSTVEGERK